MKMKLRCRSLFVVLLIAVLIFNASSIAAAQQGTAKIQAKQDAEADVNKPFWIGIGFVGSVSALYAGVLLDLAINGIGIDLFSSSSSSSSKNDDMAWLCGSASIGLLLYGFSIPRMVPVNPPPKRFLGKSPEYIETYTDAYKSRARQIRMMSAALAGVVPSIGCIMLLEQAY